jgi:hypothetical protein
VYAEPFVMVKTSYALAVISKCFAFVKCICILSLNEKGYQTADQSGLMICAQLSNIYNSNLHSQ